MTASRITLAAIVLGTLLGSGCDVVEGDGIGPDGGIVVSEDGRMALEIPQGALDESVELRITKVATPQGAVSAMYMVEPMGLVLHRPAALVFDYDDAMVDGHDVDALALVAHRETDWTYLGDQRVDDGDQTVSASLIALSPVTVVLDD